MDRELGTIPPTSDSLTGQTTVIEGLAALQTGVLLLVQLQDGNQHSAILRPAASPNSPSRWRRRSSRLPLTTGSWGPFISSRGPITWQTFARVGYRFKKVDGILGYRYTYWDFDDNGVLDDLDLSGPMVGVKVRF